MVIGKRWSEPFDRICHSLSFLLFFPSIDNRRNDWREGETERERREKRRNRERGKKETIDGWNDRSSMRVETTSVFSLDLYHGKMKILFRLYSFTGRRAGFNKGHLNRSTNRRFSLDSAVCFARAHTYERRKWVITQGIYQVGTRVPGMERFIRQTGTILFRIRRTGLLPFLSFLFFSLSLLLPPWTMESEIRERRETLLAFPLLSSLFFRNVDKIAVVCYFNQLLLLN